MLIQLANSRLPQREREAITAVLTFTSAQQQQQQQFDVISNNLLMNQLQNLQNLAIVQQTLAAQQQQQHQQQQQMQGAGKRPSTIQPMSQEELQTHANLIMQNALIKRKIEEQTNVMGLQKILQLNAAAQVAKHQQIQQPQNRNMNAPPSNQNVHNSSRNPTGNRRLQALQNLFNDSNGMVDNVQQQQQNNVGQSGGNASVNYRYNRNNANQTQGRRASGSASSTQHMKFASDTDVNHQQHHQQKTKASADNHFQMGPIPNPHHLPNPRSNKMHMSSQISAALITGGGSKYTSIIKYFVN